MKKAKKDSADELRPEYKPSDFNEPLERGKYAKRARESSNIVVLKPELAEAFPNDDAVNDALQSLLELAQRTAGSNKPAADH